MHPSAKVPVVAVLSSLPVALAVARLTGLAPGQVLALLLGGLLLAGFVAAWAARPAPASAGWLAAVFARSLQLLVGLVVVAFVVQGLVWALARVAVTGTA
ncbi:MAG: hypothetical protein KF823_10735 [Xanthomonadales bacterium]|nr:hypothetical protein [Xanthomonadales bacterium]